MKEGGAGWKKDRGTFEEFNLRLNDNKINFRKLRKE